MSMEPVLKGQADAGLAAPSSLGRWVAAEERIANLLPEQPQHNRVRLLAEIYGYAAAAVREARDTYGEDAGPPDFYGNPWLGSPVFICGCHRSGTTLMQRLLDGHPDLLVLPNEASYFTSFSHVARPNPHRRDLDRYAAEWIARFIDPNTPPHFRLGHTSASGNPSVMLCRRLFAWQAALANEPAVPAPLTSLLALAAAFRDVAFADRTPSLWVEKTPCNELNVARLRRLPAARYIHMVRDPRSALSSLEEAYRNSGARFDADKQIRLLARSLRLADRHRRSMPERYLVVIYEDLIRDPHKEMVRVCDFLKLEMSDCLQVPTAGGVPVESNSSFMATPAGQIHRAGRPRPLPAKHELLVRALLQTAAQRFDYSLEPLNPLRKWSIQAGSGMRQLAHAVTSRLNAIDKCTPSLK